MSDIPHVSAVLTTAIEAIERVQERPDEWGVSPAWLARARITAKRWQFALDPDEQYRLLGDATRASMEAMRLVMILAGCVGAAAWIAVMFDVADSSWRHLVIDAPLLFACVFMFMRARRRRRELAGTFVAAQAVGASPAPVKDDEGYKKVVINMAPDLLEELRANARERGITVTELMRRAVALDRHVYQRSLEDPDEYVKVRAITPKS